MRKFLVGSLLAASVGSGAVIMSGTLAANADPTCFTGGTGTPQGQPVSVAENVDQSGSGWIQVCTSGPVGGTVTAAGAVNQSNPQQSAGYIVADGNSANPGPLGGYAGVSSADNGIVACAAGDYNNGATSDNSNVPNSGDNDDTATEGSAADNDPTGTVEGSATDNDSTEGTASDTDSNNQFLPLPTDPNFQTDLANDLAALQANSGPCAVPAPAAP
jgi:hypothetical protein